MLMQRQRGMATAIGMEHSSPVKPAETREIFVFARFHLMRPGTPQARSNPAQSIVS